MSSPKLEIDTDPDTGDYLTQQYVRRKQKEKILAAQYKIKQELN